MRIALCNNRYFRSSGPETYLFGLKEALEQRGHAVHPFAVRLPENELAPDADLFADPPGGVGMYLYRDYARRLSMPQKAIAGVETVYSVHARRRFRAFLDRVRPELVYTLNITNMLTPSIVYEARQRGIPVVARFSDYSLSCAAYGYFRSGHACFDCQRSLLPALIHRCVHGSLAVTGLRVMSIQLHRQLGFLRRLQACIAPSRFMAADLLRLGAQPDRVHFLPTPMWDVDRVAALASAHNNAREVAFVGRLSAEKGVEFLLRAWPQVSMDARLVIIGDDHGHHVEELRTRLPTPAFQHVDFLGPLYGDELFGRVASADLVVVPSLCADNSPNVVIEAMALGKPIVATNLGGIPDQVDATCAFLVDPWDVDGLARNIRALLSDAPMRKQMGANARLRAQTVFHPNPHLDHLEEIFKQAMTVA